MSEKFILDVTSSKRMMWFDKQHPNTIYLDERKECKPDIIGDFRDLKQFNDESFKLVVFDPPHEILSDRSAFSTKISRDFVSAYGYLKPETWQSDLKRGFKECWRVLQPFGVLLFKWSESNKTVKQIKQYFPVTPLFGQRVKSATRRNGKKGYTIWICFMKVPEISVSPKESET